jgi:peptide/nickel transport system substrate-binding protein
VALLDSLGWRIPAGGEYREKGGVRLEFGVLLPSTSRPRQRTAILAKEDLRKIGVNLIIEEADFGTFSGRIATRDFDSYYGAWQMTPSPAGIRQTWSPRTESGAGALNHGTYSNPVAGALIDSAVTEFSPARRTELFQRAYQLITDDVAAIWMYEPRNVAAAHTRLRIPSLPAQGWWTTIRQWSVDPDNRLPRDRPPGS